MGSELAGAFWAACLGIATSLFLDHLRDLRSNRIALKIMAAEIEVLVHWTNVTVTMGKSTIPGGPPVRSATIDEPFVPWESLAAHGPVLRDVLDDAAMKDVEEFYRVLHRLDFKMAKVRETDLELAKCTSTIAQNGLAARRQIDLLGFWHMVDGGEDLFKRIKEVPPLLRSKI